MTVTLLLVLLMPSLRRFRCGSIGLALERQPLLPMSFCDALASSPLPSPAGSDAGGGHVGGDLDRYARHWEALLLEEHREATARLQERRAAWTSERLEEGGIAITYAEAEPESEILGEKTVKIFRRRGVGTRIGGGGRRPWGDVFGRGDVLEMTRLTPSDGGGPQQPPFGRNNRRGRRAAAAAPSRECLVMDVGDDWMVVGVGPTWPPGLWEARRHPGAYPIRLDRAGPTAPLRAQLHALESVRGDRAGPVARFLALSSSSSSPDRTTTSAAVKEEDAAPAETIVPEEWAGQVPEWWHAAVEGGRSERGSDENHDLRHVGADDSVIASLSADAMPANLSDDGPLLSTATTTLSSSPSPLTVLMGTALERAMRSTPWRANSSQQQAILWALQQRVSLLRGPPGTGKTRVAALLMATALEAAAMTESRRSAASPSPSPPLRILAVAHSNGAADVLLEALLEVGVPAVRAGRPASVSPKVQHRTVAALAERMPGVVALRRNAGDVRATDGRDDAAAMQAWDLRRELDDAQAMLVESAPVVVTSCVGAHQLLAAERSPSFRFPLVVLDEAAQCTEPALVCALAAAQAGQLVLVGDTQQLPPTVASSSKTLRTRLGTSPMERLESKRGSDRDGGSNSGGGVDEHTLRVQYRMPPALLEHPSRYFYNGLVQSAVPENDDGEDARTSTHCTPPAGFAWPVDDQPIAFVQVGRGMAEIAHKDGGRSNPLEARCVATIVRNLLDAGDVNATGIAILTPYSKQVQAVRSALERDVTMNRTSPGAPASFGPWSDRINNGQRPGDVRIGTIDSFQGQETEVVIFSAVRSNSLAELGFLRDARRLCVAVTRARRALILVGDSTVLSTCHHWQALLQSCYDRGCWINLDTMDDGSDPESWLIQPLASNASSSKGLEAIEHLQPSCDDRATVDTVRELFVEDLLNRGGNYFGLFSAPTNAINSTFSLQTVDVDDSTG